MKNNTKASIKNLEMRIGQLSQQMATKASSNKGLISNNVDNLEIETCKAISFEK